ncbi:MAG: hypothetical protein ABI333_29075 [bacterium]
MTSTRIGILLLVIAPLQAGCRKHAAAPAARQTPESRPRRSAVGTPLLSPLDAKDTAGAKQRFVEILRRRLNSRIKDPSRQGQWDFWSEGSTSYTLPGGSRAYLMSFRRTSPQSQEGFLVIGSISGQNTVVHGFWRVMAGIDDIHVMDMGKAGPMIYTVSFDTTGMKRLIHHHLLRYDGRTIREVWSYKVGYDLEQPKTYKPVSVTFRDEDSDGTREVRIRIPGADTPRLWKRRWAMFKWDPPRNEFLPLRGLAFTPVARQKPLWAAFGFLEAMRTKAHAHALRFGSNQRGCRTAEGLWELMRQRRYRAVTPPRRKQATAPYRDRRASILVDLERPKDPHRYLAELELRRDPGGLNQWGICNIRFFRL